MAQPVKHRREGAKGAKPRKSIASRIRPIGNSKGVILSNQLIEAAGLSPEADIIIEAAEGMITIKQAQPAVNTDLSTWDAQFRAAAKKGIKPEKDLFDGIHNSFDETGW